MKKFTLKLVAVLLAAVLLMGCAGAKDNNTAQGDAQVSSGQSTAQQSDAQQNETTTPAPTENPAATATPVPEPEGPYIRELFAEHGLKSGVCLTTRMINTPKFADIITSNFSSVTMENDMKPDAILNQAKCKAAGEIVITFGDNAIKMLDWARANGLAVRGHTLIWHSQTPVWLFHENFDASQPFLSREAMLERMEEYIRKVFEKLEELGYIDLIYAYDIVNEAWMEDGKIREGQNYWYQTIGDDYLWYAFYFANKYAPESIDLYYNDYNEQFKTETFLKFVDTLRDEEGNYLLDGIGLQAHLYTSDNLEQYFNMLDRLSGTGLKLQLTELDVCLGAYQKELKPTDENLQRQGRFYYNLINGILERVDSGSLKMDALTFWGFADSMSWRSSYSPLLFDTYYKPKYAYYGALQIRDKAGY